MACEHRWVQISPPDKKGIQETRCDACLALLEISVLIPEEETR